MNWKLIQSSIVPENVELWTKIDDSNGERNIQKLTKKGSLWWADGMYVYYTPTHWSY